MHQADFAERRAAMVERQIAARGVHDARVLAALRAVPREAFVPLPLRDRACDDRPLGIGEGQTISQPYIVALMAQCLELRGQERVLEVGTGSGYAAAVLATLAAQVYSVERIAALADAARQRLQALGLQQVQIRCGDGSLGWPEHAPFDAISVAASGPVVPDALRQQLAIGGNLVMPVGTDLDHQELLRVTRVGAQQYRTERITGVCFVPLLGAQGWPA